MAWIEFLKTYLIVIVVGGVLLIIVLVLFAIIYNLYRNLERLQHKLTILSSDKQITMTPSDYGRLERQQTLRKYQSLRTATITREESPRKRSAKHELETHEEDYRQRRVRSDSDDDEEAQFSSQRRGMDRVMYYKENPLSPWNRQQNQQISQIYRSHMNRYPSQKPNAYIQASSRSLSYQMSNEGAHDDQQQSYFEQEDDTLEETSATVMEQNQSLDNTNEESVHESEIDDKTFDDELPPSSFKALTPPRPIRADSRHYKLSSNHDEENVEDNQPLSGKLGGLAYLESVLSPSELQNLTIQLKSLSFPQLQQKVRELIDRNNLYRSQNKLPPRMISDRIEDALDRMDSRDSADRAKDTGAVSELLLRYGQIITAENEKFLRRIKSSVR